MMKADWIRSANKTCRENSSIGKNALVPRKVRQVCRPGRETILDFGAGRNAIHTQSLKEEGFLVTAHEFGENFDPHIHERDALTKEYDVVMVSNVLNVQVTLEMLHETVQSICGCVKEGGYVIANYPKSPRKLGLSEKEMYEVLSKYGFVEKSEGQVYYVYLSNPPEQPHGHLK